MDFVQIYQKVVYNLQMYSGTSDPTYHSYRYQAVFCVLDRITQDFMLNTTSERLHRQSDLRKQLKSFKPQSAGSDQALFITASKN